MACLNPIDVRRPDWAVVRRYIQVPCGKCVGCRLDRSRNWTIRIMHEKQMHKENCFLTLTIKDSDLVYGRMQATLYKPHLQKFWKRLRKEISPNEVRYFACGEYGEQYNRPHYHACLFGFDFPDKTLLSTEAGNNLYHSDMLDTIWSHGHCSIGALDIGSAAYVARYILDKRLGDERKDYEIRGIEPEYVVMSRRPGIGAAWFNRFAGDVYPADRVVLDDGRTVRPPRYYDELRKLDEPQEIEKIKIARMIAAENKTYEEKSAIRMINKLRFHESHAKKIRDEKNLH